eukprot:sb/3463389/
MVCMLDFTYRSIVGMVRCSGVCWALLIEVQLVCIVGMVRCSGVCWALLIEVQLVWCGAAVKYVGLYLKKYSRYGEVQWSVLGFTYRSTASMVWYSGVCTVSLKDVPPRPRPPQKRPNHIFLTKIQLPQGFLTRRIDRSRMAKLSVKQEAQSKKPVAENVATSLADELAEIVTAMNNEKQNAPIFKEDRDTRIEELIRERATLLSTGVYTASDFLISEIDRHRYLLDVVRHPNLWCDPDGALKIYYSITKQTASSEEEEKVIEQALLSMGKLLAQKGRVEELSKLIKSIRPFLGTVSKAKASKIVRELVDTFLDMESSTGVEIPLCLECIDWAKSEKRTFLTQALEGRLILLYHSVGQYSEALTTVNRVLKVLKKMDDKHLLMEIQLSESKVYHTLRNIPKARAALTSARTTANSIYVPPKLQASLDMQSGLKYSGRGIDAMQAIADAGKKRDIAIFNQTISKYEAELQKDGVIESHLKSLYDTLLEKNLVRIIEPYSRVQLSHVAETIALPYEVVERKLSQIILDKKFSGILDQRSGVLIVFDASEEDQTYTYALETISHMGKVVDALFKKAQKLS